MEVGGLLLPALRAAPPGPQALHSARPGCARWHALGGPGRGRNIPPVCRPAQAGAGSSWPRPVAPHPFWQGRPCAGINEALMWLGPDLSSSLVSLPQQRDWGCWASWVPRALICGLGHVRLPASSLRTIGISREQRWLLWLREGDLPAGHTARDVGGPRLKAQPRGLQSGGRTPSHRTSRPARPS